MIPIDINYNILINKKDEPDCIFIHIPRTGGRSIHYVMGIQFNGIHKSIKNHIDELTEPVVKNKFKFAVVRNPWERAVILWQLYLFHAYRARQTPDMCFLNFENWLRIKMKFEPNYSEFMEFPIDELFYCRDYNNNVLIDTFLRFENLSHDFVPIAQKFNKPATLPTIGETDRAIDNDAAKKLMEKMVDAQVNCGNMNSEDKIRVMSKLPIISKNYKDMYESQESIDLVASVNRELIERFEYSF